MSYTNPDYPFPAGELLAVQQPDELVESETTAEVAAAEAAVEADTAEGTAALTAITDPANEEIFEHLRPSKD